MGYYFSDAMEPEETTVIAYCSRCKGEIYSGEEYTTDGERVLCPLCNEEKFVAPPLWAKAQLMGYEVKGGASCRR